MRLAHLANAISISASIKIIFGVMTFLSAASALADDHFEVVTGGQRRVLVNSAGQIMMNANQPGHTGMNWTDTRDNGANFSESPATLTVQGPIFANAGAGEHLIKNQWKNQNTLAIQNSFQSTTKGGSSYSAIRWLDWEGSERMALGFGNPVYDSNTGQKIYPGHNFLESSNIFTKDGKFNFNDPPPGFQIRLTGNINGHHGNYIRQNYKPNGDISFYRIGTEPEEEKREVLRVQQDGRILSSSNNMIGVMTERGQDNSIFSLSATSENDSNRGARINLSGVNRKTYGGLLELHSGASGDMHEIQFYVGQDLKGRFSQAGFELPKITTAQRNSLRDVRSGTMIYNLTTNKINFFNGTSWRMVSDEAAN